MSVHSTRSLAKWAEERASANPNNGYGNSNIPCATEAPSAIRTPTGGAIPGRNRGDRRVSVSGSNAWSLTGPGPPGRATARNVLRDWNSVPGLVEGKGGRFATSEELLFQVRLQSPSR